MTVFNRRVSFKWLLLVPLIAMFGCTSFTLTSQPKADIYENGEKIGTTPYRFKLVSGMRSFTLKRYGYVEQDILVSSLDPNNQHYNLQWVGRTRVDTFPAGAKVVRIEDNEVLGITPCGLHLARPALVMLKLNGYQEVERELSPNQTYNIELQPVSGFKSAFYREIMFTSEQGPVIVFDKVAGEELGITPVRLTIEAGTPLEYRKYGYKPESEIISRNAPHRIEIELEPLGQIILNGPAGAEVYPAGGTRKIGDVPIIVEVDGSALYEIKKEGYYDRTVAVSPTSPKQLNVELEEIPYKTIITTPPGGDIYRLGGLEKLGTSPYTTIISGECVFEIKKEGYKPYVIGVGPSSPEQLRVPLSPVPRDDPDAAAIGDLDNPVVDTY